MAAPEASPSRNARILVSRKAVSHIVDMNRQTRQPSVFSKVSVKSQTVIPREVRERLRLRPGLPHDRSRHRARQGTGKRNRRPVHNLFGMVERGRREGL